MKHPTLCSLAVLLPLVACSSAPSAPRTSATPPPPFPIPAPFQKVFVVVLENTDAETALEQPFLRALADRGALLTNYSFSARPSQPNYLALTSGSTHGVATNRNVDLDVRHLGDLLEAKGRSWKSYAEDYPGGCFLKPKSSRGHYVRKHEPFLSYRNVQNDPAASPTIFRTATTRYCGRSRRRSGWGRWAEQTSRRRRSAASGNSSLRPPLSGRSAPAR